MSDPSSDPSSDPAGAERERPTAAPGPLDPPRPRTLVVVVGTGTEVGKTWVTARLLERWRAGGLRVAARKPAQSFEPGDDADERTDAQILGAASGEPATVVCPSHRWYPVPMAPPIAAAVLRQDPFTIAALAREIGWDAGTDVGVVETAGGIRSPQADDGDAITLIDQLAPDVVLLVADAGLGTINAVTLSLEALGTSRPHRQATFLNRFDASNTLHRRNRAWLHDRLGVDAITDAGDLAARVLSPRAG